ncbi:unnamed protein product [Heligmosomoides polygyrus]|uniref:BPI2 domain-containing protein n=1 Tax=Heligmosomoides polygyrus TaxID=6339 RepID=A0A183GMS4_HELPZ|nr:unnamed protein product [Heligmosomoides polygyrus]
MLSCNVQIGYADAYIENGGIIGDIINSQFRASPALGSSYPHFKASICGQLPSIINEKLNGRLASMPQAIAVTQMLSMFAGALPLGGQGPAPSPQFCQAQCRGRAPAPQLPAPQSTAVAPSAPQIPSAPVALSGPAQAPQIPQAAYNERPVARGTQQKVYHTNQAAPLRRIPARQAAAAPTSKRYRAVVSSNGSGKVFVPLVRNKRQTAHTVVHRVTKLASSPTALAHVVRNSRGAGGYQQQQVYIHRPIPGGLYRPPPTIGGYYPGQGAPLGPIPPVPGAPPAMLVPPVPDLCAMCTSSGASEDPMSFLRQLAAGLDMRKLSDLYLSIQLLATHATSNDFTVDLTGEFSPNGQGGTPFGAFPVQFPYAYDDHMAEFILSDYTVNTLFYWLHRKQFLTFRIGPDTPKIGELLKTTCSEDEDDELEGTEVELDEEEAQRRRRKVARLSKTLRTLRSRRSAKNRGKRQDAGGLADLGICFGDILPAVREKYPNQKIAIQIRTVRAPSVILSQARGGMMILDLVADADIYIDGTNTRVGTITIAATIVLVAQIRGNRLTGTAEITNLKLTDRAGTLGLPQDALDNLGNLGKELIQKLANDALQKGIVINIPQGGLGGLPINIINPSVRIIEHGLYIATDITVSPSLLGIDGRRC